MQVQVDAWENNVHDTDSSMMRHAQEHYMLAIRDPLKKDIRRVDRQQLYY